MSKKLNRWQEEITKLKDVDNVKVANELRKQYETNLKEIRRLLKNYSGEIKNMPYWQQLRFGKYQALEKQLVEILEHSGTELSLLIEDYGIDQYKKGYGELFYTSEFELGVDANMNMLDTSSIRQIVEHPTSGGRLSSKLWENRDTLAGQIDHALSLGLIQGLGYEKIASNIELAMASDYKKALRIARTEGSRVYGLGQVQAQQEFKKLGFKPQKMWIASLDSVTRSSHRHLDGQLIGVDELFKGKMGRGLAPGLFGVAGEDINCRCKVITILDEHSMPTTRHDNVSKKLIKFKSYEEWMKENEKNKDTSN